MRTTPKIEDTHVPGLISVDKRSALFGQPNLREKMAMVLKLGTPNSLFCKEMAE